MILQKRVRAGVLLYALLMLAIFSLFLQFYINRQLAESRSFFAQKEGTKAYLMAELTMDQLDRDWTKQAAADKQSSQTTSPSLQKQESAANLLEIPKEGKQGFTEGLVHYRMQGSQVDIDVQLSDGHTFSYRFYRPQTRD